MRPVPRCGEVNSAEETVNGYDYDQRHLDRSRQAGAGARRTPTCLAPMPRSQSFPGTNKSAGDGGRAQATGRSRRRARVPQRVAANLCVGGSGLVTAVRPGAASPGVFRPTFNPRSCNPFALCSTWILVRGFACTNRLGPAAQIKRRMHSAS